MENIMNSHKKTMGETGAGITSADEINMDETNDFTNKWGMYRKSGHQTTYPR
jgi:hypothetical protein